MVTQNATTQQSDLKTALDLILVAFGVVSGGVIALLGLWLWFDYQADPSHSSLALLSASLAGWLPDYLGLFLIRQTRLMGLPLAADTSAFWYMARAGGLVAYLLLWLSTLWGLTLSTKVTRGLISPLLGYGLHEFLSILALVFAGLHAVVLLGDSYIKFNLLHLLIPFTAPYRPLWTGLGSLALYLSLALTVSFYLRRVIGQKIWRVFHYSAFAAYLLALAHGFLAGSDSALLATRLIYIGTGFSVLFLLYYRLLTLKPR